MKKINHNGFTLIELLAVIVIMGILMMVAIPAVSRTIENARKDTFIETAKSYVNAVQTLWTADGLRCGNENTVSSAVDDGDYYVEINTRGKKIKYDGTFIEDQNITVPTILEQGGKSSWGNRDVSGYVRVNVATAPVWCEKNKSRDDAKLYCPSAGNICVHKNHTSTKINCSSSDVVILPEGKHVTRYYIALSDGTHGISAETSNNFEASKLTRGRLQMSNLKAIPVPRDSTKCIEN